MIPQKAKKTIAGKSPHIFRDKQHLEIHGWNFPWLYLVYGGWLFRPLNGEVSIALKRVALKNHSSKCNFERWVEGYKLGWFHVDRHQEGEVFEGRG